LEAPRFCFGKVKESEIMKKIFGQVNVLWLSVMILGSVLAFSGCQGRQSQQATVQQTPINTAAAQPTATPQKITLRSKPLQVAEAEMPAAFSVDPTNWRPLTYSNHSYQARGDVVVDQMTGLVWQKSGSPEPIGFAQAKTYIAQLNQQKFGGYTDWRLPTMPELLALVEQQAQAQNWYLNRIFDRTQLWCWSADTPGAEDAWGVNFERGSVNFLNLTNCYVRAVRSGQ
jgi:hypothetical protein